MNRKLMLLAAVIGLAVTAPLEAGTAFAQDSTYVQGNGYSQKVTKHYGNGRYGVSESFYRDRNGRRCRAVARTVRTPFGVRRSLRRGCNF